MPRPFRATNIALLTEGVAKGEPWRIPRLAFKDEKLSLSNPQNVTFIANLTARGAASTSPTSPKPYLPAFSTTEFGADLLG